MTRPQLTPAAISQPTSHELALSGCWTALGIGTLGQHLDALPVVNHTEIIIDGMRIEALDTAGMLILHRLMQRLRSQGSTLNLRDWRPEFTKLLELISQYSDTPKMEISRRPALERLGRSVAAILEETFALLNFIGENAVAVASILRQPKRLRWRPILHNIYNAGFSALPIIGLLSFLVGVVIAYQVSGQLRRYGANIFVVELVGLSMLREFAPLMTAIIVAGRSGSAYAAQIGTMVVTEEIDAMRTIGIQPLDLLVIPKVFALLIALPLLTIYADLLGVCGGIITASAQLGIGYEDFLDRFVNTIDLTDYLIGFGKAPVFAAIITVVGCFQGFRTKGGGDSVGRQATRSVVQAIFLVIVADALFSVLFSLMDL
jgi:phospholipid/cholesterol/gamma-HCH transport system permease protein